MADLLEFVSRSLPFSLPDEPGFSSAWDERARGFSIKVPSGELLYADNFFSTAWSDRMVAYLQENDAVDWRSVDWRNVSPEALDRLGFKNVRWKQDRLKFYGKELPLPRLTAWYGDPGAAYTYSGIKSEPNPWTDGLLHIRRKIEEAVDSTFNCVLLNWYRDGKDSLSWHADDEKELGAEPVIASANFGATRDFQLRNTTDHSQKITIPLRHGTLLVMRGKLQQYWKHAVPKRANLHQSRFNLTFRTIGA